MNPDQAGGVNSPWATISRLIEKSAALFVCKALLREILAALVAQATMVGFQTELVALRDLA